MDDSQFVAMVMRRMDEADSNELRELARTLVMRLLGRFSDEEMEAARTDFHGTRH